MPDSDVQPQTLLAPTRPGLKKIAPYWYPYTTMAKERWLGRELLEVVSTEFRDRSIEFYRYALESGVTTVNGEVARPNTIIRNGDRIENIVHRHEPPVTSVPVRIIHHDVEREFLVIDKPGSIPVHAAGRYYRNTLVEILHNDFGFEKAYTVNRLDRLTSGLMIIPLSVECARQVSSEFMKGTVRKEYIARCKGKFPAEETTCEEPLLTVDRQMGLNIVHPDGKPATTIFNLLHYDAETNSSVLRCRPLTGRSHQIRVHLQFLGHPIANDPIYSEPRIWGPALGKGGLDIAPSDERAAPAPPAHIALDGASPESLDGPMPLGAVAPPPTKLLPRETGHDIGMGSPVPLSAEAVGVITRLRNMKDENEDWGRWRDVVFRARAALTPPRVERTTPLPPHNKRRRGGPTDAFKKELSAQGKSKRDAAAAAASSGVTEPAEHVGTDGSASPSPVSVHAADVSLKAPAAVEPAVDVSELTPSPAPVLVADVSSETAPPAAATANALQDATLQPASTLVENASLQAALAESLPPQLSPEEALAKIKAMEAVEDPTALVQSDNTYCPECYLPLHPDPKPERLYIFLHALQYTTQLGTFETEMPLWAAPGWTWDQD